MFRVINNTNIDVYLWQGKSYKSAYLAVEGNTWNAPAKVDTDYAVKADEGMLIVTVPRKDERQTNLSFMYWADNDYKLSGT